MGLYLGVESRRSIYFDVWHDAIFTHLENCVCVDVYCGLWQNPEVRKLWKQIRCMPSLWQPQENRSEAALGTVPGDAQPHRVLGALAHASRGSRMRPCSGARTLSASGGWKKTRAGLWSRWQNEALLQDATVKTVYFPAKREPLKGLKAKHVLILFANKNKSFYTRR